MCVRSEATEAWLLELAEQQRWAVLAADWRGLAKADLPVPYPMILTSPRLLMCVPGVGARFAGSAAHLQCYSRQIHTGDTARPDLQTTHHELRICLSCLPLTVQAMVDQTVLASIARPLVAAQLSKSLSAPLVTA